MAKLRFYRRDSAASGKKPGYVRFWMDGQEKILADGSVAVEFECEWGLVQANGQLDVLGSDAFLVLKKHKRLVFVSTGGMRGKRLIRRRWLPVVFMR